MNELLAIDPGETVGWALFSYNGDDEINKIDADQVEWKTFLERMEKITHSDDRNFKVLIENYTIRKNTMAANINKELITVKVIGVIEWICRKKGIEVVFQPAGIGKAFFDKQRLKEMDLWVVGKKHARDAIRHGMWHLIFGRDE